jgi:hypothetical protein
MNPSIRLIASLCACMLWLQSGLATATKPVPEAPQAEITTHAEGDAETNSGAPARDVAARDAHDAYWRGVAERLLAGQASVGACPAARDPASCLVAARLLWVVNSRRELTLGSHPPQSERDRMRALLASAAVRAHEDPMLYWVMTWDVFKREAPALRELAIVELRRREPDNLQVWLLSLAGEAWTQKRLQAAARSTRFETHLYDLLRADLERLAEIAADAPAVDGLPFEPTAVESVQEFLFGMLMAEAMPGLQGLFESCSAVDPAVQAEAHADCWRIAEHLVEHAESVVDLALGSALMRRIARDPLQRERAAQARLDYEYLQEGIVETFKSGEQQRLFMQRIREPGRTEISAARLTLVDAGLPSELPPAR